MSNEKETDSEAREAMSDIADALDSIGYNVETEETDDGKVVTAKHPANDTDNDNQ